MRLLSVTILPLLHIPFTAALVQPREVASQLSPVQPVAQTVQLVRFLSFFLPSHPPKPPSIIHPIHPYPGLTYNQTQPDPALRHSRHVQRLHRQLHQRRLPHHHHRHFQRIGRRAGRIGRRAGLQRRGVSVRV